MHVAGLKTMEVFEKKVVTEVRHKVIALLWAIWLSTRVSTAQVETLENTQQKN